jgi:hypothetical protein
MNGTFTSYAAVLMMPMGQVVQQRTIGDAGRIRHAGTIRHAGPIRRAGPGQAAAPGRHLGIGDL